MAAQDLGGQTLGQYQLVNLLGAGGMGTVYRGYQVTLKREVAIKILPPEVASTPAYLDRFTREAETAARLEHPHIIPIYDYGTERGITYLVMRLLSGGTLSERVNRRREQGQVFFPLEDVSVILRQIGSALDYAHERKVIHRDVKPANIMFDEQGTAYLGDFGIAKILEANVHLTATGGLIGTPVYMSPEQWRGDPLTPASDQYALAVVIYQLVAGRSPFQGDTPYALMQKHLTEPPTPPQAFRMDLSEGVAKVLSRSMAKQPEERYSTLTEFAEAFANAVETAKTRPASPPTRRKVKTQQAEQVRTVKGETAFPPAAARPLIGRRQATVFAVSGVALLAALVILFLLLRPRPGVELTPTSAALVDTSQPVQETAAVGSDGTPPPSETSGAPPINILEASATLEPTSTAAEVETPSSAAPPTEALISTTAATIEPSPIATTPSAPLVVPLSESTETVIPAVTDIPEVISVPPTDTPAPTATDTATLTDTPQPPSPTASDTAIVTPTDTPVPLTLTPSDTATATLTPSPTSTFTLTFTPTNTDTATATPSPTLTPPPALPEGMILVPGGNYRVGSMASLNALPVQQVELEPFVFDTTEVTRGAFAQFVQAGGYESSEWWTPEGWAWRQSITPVPRPVSNDADLPVSSTTWYEADAYCRWRGGRLPTETEWEVAAGWNAQGIPFTYPWGDEPPSDELANFNNETAGPRAVASYPPNELGLYDMAGNVAEWVARNPDDGSYIIRGGSYISTRDENLQITNRVVSVPDILFNAHIGFRCALTLDGS